MRMRAHGACTERTEEKRCEGGNGEKASLLHVTLRGTDTVYPMASISLSTIYTPLFKIT